MSKIFTLSSKYKANEPSRSENFILEIKLRASVWTNERKSTAMESHSRLIDGGFKALRRRLILSSKDDNTTSNLSVWDCFWCYAEKRKGREMRILGKKHSWR
ncbi:hypothetical protein O6P43_026078 [Quillaja saponaria]|uniref:Uncharacterized protein n=1 Tax=Quillaja saponaria TaxID=32244 RepID=A0AAD7PGB6_QUISA|nr:hypothetical protein O6P43_026078 [Quillaja saponaria]